MPKDSGIGASTKRREDIRFLTGLGQYTDDISLTGETHAVFARSEVANGIIKSIDSFVIKVNLIGTFNMLSRAAAQMAKQEPLDDDGGRGAIVNLASAAAFDGQIGQCAYSASKAGVVGMALPIARDLAAVGVRVNTVAPGLIDTPIYGEGPESDAFKAHLGKSVLFPKRLGSAEELAFSVIDCITNPYMNAEVIRLDGGIRMPPK